MKISKITDYAALTLSQPNMSQAYPSLISVLLVGHRQNAESDQGFQCLYIEWPIKFSNKKNRKTKKKSFLL